MNGKAKPCAATLLLNRLVDYWIDWVDRNKGPLVTETGPMLLNPLAMDPHGDDLWKSFDSANDTLLLVSASASSTSALTIC